MVTVMRRETFSASHRLYRPNFTNEQNERVFGKCSNPNGHGHNYELEVFVDGEPDPETGFVIDLKELKRIIRAEVIDKVDHKNLNVEVDFLSGVIPTAENIAVGIWKVLAPTIRTGRLSCIRLRETENNVVEYRGH
jgi:6-pyruvoyltetrahydropterin/6-carboxytetrahydropterin synthase